MPTPSFIHQKISMKLSRELSFFVENQQLGEVLASPMDTKFDDDNCVQPDILYIEVSRYSIIKENYIEGSPDLMVEIWSPSNKKRERDEKHNLYESQGVKEYWTIFPKKREVIVEKLENNTFQIHSKGKKTGIIQSSILEGFEIKIEDLYLK
jgi:Uma2 family endonuclease